MSVGGELMDSITIEEEEFIDVDDEGPEFAGCGCCSSDRLCRCGDCDYCVWR